MIEDFLKREVFRRFISFDPTSSFKHKNEYFEFKCKEFKGSRVIKEPGKFQGQLVDDVLGSLHNELQGSAEQKTYAQSILDSEYKIYLMISPGSRIAALQAIFDYCEQHPECKNLIESIQMMDGFAIYRKDSAENILPNIIIRPTLGKKNVKLLLQHLQTALAEFNSEKHYYGRQPSNASRVPGSVLLSYTYNGEEVDTLAAIQVDTKEELTSLPKLPPFAEPLLSKDLIVKIEKYFQDNTSEVKISRKKAAAYGLGDLKYSVIRDQESNIYALYEGKTNILGRGSQGKVKWAQDVNGDWWAVKISDINKDINFSWDAESLFLRQQQLYKSKAVRPHKGYIFQKALIGGTPFNDIFKDVKKPNFMNAIMQEFLNTTTALITAVNEMHEKGIIHRDLKPDNILQNLDGTCHILDFGLAIQLAPDKISYEGQVLGTNGYIEPQRGMTQIYDRASDLWACGQILMKALIYLCGYIDVNYIMAPEVNENLEKIKQVIENLQDIRSSRPDSTTFLAQITRLKEEITPVNDTVFNSLHMAVLKNDQDAITAAITVDPNAMHVAAHQGVTPLHLAIMIGNITALKKFGDCFKGYNAADRDPVLLALDTGQIDIACIIATGERGCPDISLHALIHALIMTNKLDHLIALRKYFPDFNFWPSSPANPVFRDAIITGSGRLEMVKYLVENGVNPNEVSQDKSNILHWAAQSEDADLLPYCLSLPALKIDINEPNDDGDTPLSLAIKNNKLKAVEALLAKGATTEPIIQAEGFAFRKRYVEVRLLELALETMNLDMAWLIFQKEAEPDQKDLMQLLFLSIYDRRHDVSEQILAHAMQPKNLIFQSEYTIHFAARVGDKIMLQRLLELGDDPDRKTEYNITPLMKAAEAGQVAIIDVLAQTNKIDLNAFSYERHTALVMAIMKNRKEVVARLLELGADPELGFNDVNRYTYPIAIAIEGNQPDIAFMLYEKISAKGPLAEFMLEELKNLCTQMHRQDLLDKIEKMQSRPGLKF